MKELYSPAGEMDLLILRSVLDDAGIPYFVRNDTFGSLYGASFAAAHNRKTISVPEADWEEAAALLDEFLQRTGRSAELAELAAEERPAPGALGRLAERLLAWAVARFGDAEAAAAGPRLTLLRGGAADRPAPPEGGEAAAARPVLHLIDCAPAASRGAAADATGWRRPPR